MSIPHAQTSCENLRVLIAAHLGIKAPTLQRAAKKAGRLLPARTRRDIAFLVEAEAFATHPKLHLAVDDTKLKQAHDAVVAYLKTIDPKENRKTAMLRLLGTISFNLILVVVGLVGFLMWRGYL